MLEWVPILAGDAVRAAILVHAQLGERAKALELIERPVSELPRVRVHTVEWEEFPTVGGNLTHSVHDERRFCLADEVVEVDTGPAGLRRILAAHG